LLAFAGPAGSAEPIDPWPILERLRAALDSDGPLVAEFRQTYLPAGFESGDSESGLVSLSLPDCLRWDYLEPYRKSFLICGDQAWSWVEGEPRGQRLTLDAERVIGLDLLLLSSTELAGRYRATASRGVSGGSQLELEPLDDDAELERVGLTIDPPALRPAVLEWHDREGNRTEFRFRSWRRSAEELELEPPAHLDWVDPSAADPVR
jgi:outer membrane lipoprotein carrier protein